MELQGIAEIRTDQVNVGTADPWRRASMWGCPSGGRLIDLLTRPVLKAGTRLADT